MSEETPPAHLLNDPLVVINLGLEGFSHDLVEQGGKVAHVDWSPPAGGDARLAELLSKLGV